MSVYAVISIRVTDEAKYAEYVALASPTVDVHRAERIGYDVSPRVIEGGNPAERLAVLRFDDDAHFDRWYYSPEYQRAKEVRDQGAEAAFIMVMKGRDWKA